MKYMLIVIFKHFLPQEFKVYARLLYHIKALKAVQVLTPEIKNSLFLPIFPHASFLLYKWGFDGGSHVDVSMMSLICQSTIFQLCQDGAT